MRIFILNYNLSLIVRYIIKSKVRQIDWGIGHIIDHDFLWVLSLTYLPTILIQKDLNNLKTNSSICNIKDPSIYYPICGNWDTLSSKLFLDRVILFIINIMEQRISLIDELRNQLFFDGGEYLDENLVCVICRELVFEPLECDDC